MNEGQRQGQGRRWGAAIAVVVTVSALAAAACGGSESAPSGGGAAGSSAGTGAANAMGGAATGGAANGGAVTGGSVSGTGGAGGAAKGGAANGGVPNGGAGNGAAGNGGTGTGGVASGDFWRDYARAFCKASARCCGVLKLPNDEAKCLQYFEASMTPPGGDLYDEAILPEQQGHLKLDPAVAAKCLAALETQDCNERSTAACDGLMVGLLATGQTCRRRQECARPAGGFADCSSFTAGNHCTSALASQLGQTCASTIKDVNGSTWQYDVPGATRGENPCYINLGFYCGEDRLCHALKAVGGSCGNDYECTEGLRCIGATCAAPIALGAACTAETAFKHPCVAGAYCDKVCKPQQPAGGACTSFDGCLSGKCDAGKCEMPRLRCF